MATSIQLQIYLCDQGGVEARRYLVVEKRAALQEAQALIKTRVAVEIEASEVKLVGGRRGARQPRINDPALRAVNM
jgi:hypothetical protein